MSDDLRDAFGEDIFAEPEEEFEEEEAEAQNRTFLIIALALGGLLVVALVAFGLFWALVLNPRMRQATEIQATNTAIAALVANGGPVTSEAEPPLADEDEENGEESPSGEEAEPTATETPEPTATETPVIRATNTPTPTPEADEMDGEAEDEDADAENGGTTEAGEDAEVTATATSRPRRSPTPTRTPYVTDTEPDETTDETPETGLGELLLVLAGGLLIGLMILVRSLRSA